MKPQVVSFRCVLKNSTGTLISTTFSRDVLTEAPAGAVAELPGLAEKMKNLQSGEKRRIWLKANEAYGLYDLSLVLRLPRRELPGKKRFEIGDEVNANSRRYRVVEVQGDMVTLDANHPLAGQDLIFDIDVVEARNATEEEIREFTLPDAPRYLH